MPISIAPTLPISSQKLQTIPPTLPITAAANNKNKPITPLQPTMPILPIKRPAAPILPITKPSLPQQLHNNNNNNTTNNKKPNMPVPIMPVISKNSNSNSNSNSNLKPITIPNTNSNGNTTNQPMIPKMPQTSQMPQMPQISTIQPPSMNSIQSGLHKTVAPVIRMPNNKPTMPVIKPVNIKTIPQIRQNIPLPTNTAPIQVPQFGNQQQQNKPKNIRKPIMPVVRPIVMPKKT